VDAKDVTVSGRPTGVGRSSSTGVDASRWWLERAAVVERGDQATDCVDGAPGGGIVGLPGAAGST
jgi:hypothetical protein